MRPAWLVADSRLALAILVPILQAICRLEGRRRRFELLQGNTSSWFFCPLDRVAKNGMWFAAHNELSVEEKGESEFGR